MDIKKLVPWNWFKKEGEEFDPHIPIRYAEPEGYPEGRVQNPIRQLHQEMDRLFDDVFRGLGRFPFTSMTSSGLLKPQVDIGATDTEYSISVEIPGVEKDDVKVEIVNDTMIISGEKRQEKEEKEKNYYRVERSYGSFQRELSLPEDVDRSDVKGTFKNGILTVTMGRKALPKGEAKKIDIISMD